MLEVAVGERGRACTSFPFVPVAELAESVATNVPVSSPVVEVLRADARSAGKPPRDPRFVIALLAIVLGVVGAAALIALLVS